MQLTQRFITWQQTKSGLLVLGLLQLALAYAFVSWAIDSGSLLDYFIAIVLIIGGIQNFVKLAVLLWKGRDRHVA